MDEKKEEAILKATKKLLETKTPEEDILISLEELGLGRVEGEKYIAKARKQAEEEPEAETESAAPAEKSGGVKQEEAPAEKGKGHEKSAGQDEGAEKKPAFWKKFLEKKAETEKPRSGEKGAAESGGKTFIPKLKKGGLGKVKEIFPESPLDRRDEGGKTGAAESEKKSAGKERTEGIKGLTNKNPELIKMISRPSPEKKGAFAAEKGDEKIGGVQAAGKEKISLAMKSAAAESTLPEGKVKAGGLDILEKNIESGGGINAGAPEVAGRHDEKTEGELTMLIIPNVEYGKGITMLARKMGSQYGKVLYVSLNEIYKTLVERLKKNGVDVGKFFFIDAITLTSVRDAEKHGNCIFVSSPNSLIELSLAITQAMNSEKPEALIFDSISTLLIYEKETTVTKFIHSLIGKIKAVNVDAYFTALEGDSMSDSIKDLSMFVDNVRTLNQFELSELGVTGYASIGKGAVKRASVLKELQEMALPAGAATPEKKRRAEMPERNAMIAGEMRRLQAKLEEMQSDKKVQKTLEEISGRIAKVESLSSLQGEVKEIAKKISQRPEKPVDLKLVNQISKLELKIGSLEKKLAEKEGKRKASEKTLLIKTDKSPAEKAAEKRESLREKIEAAESRKQMQKTMQEFYKMSASAAKSAAAIAGLEKAFTKKNAEMEKAYKKGAISRKDLDSGKTRMKKEIVMVKNSAKVEALEKKLGLLNEAFDSGVVSRKAYVKDKAKIENLLKG